MLEQPVFYGYLSPSGEKIKGQIYLLPSLLEPTIRPLSDQFEP